MNAGAGVKAEWQRLVQSVDKAFQRAEELNAVFEKSEKPRQQKIVEILGKHGLPAFVGHFFDLSEGDRIHEAGNLSPQMERPV